MAKVKVALPPTDDWHRTAKHKAVLRRLIKLVYGDEYTYLEGHHISVVKCSTEESVREWASVETMIFDLWFMQTASKKADWEWPQSILAIALCPAKGRLALLNKWLPKEIKNGKGKGSDKTPKKVSRPAARTRRRD